MDSNETQKQQESSYGRNAAAPMGPTSTSQAMQDRLSLGSTLSLRQPQQPSMQVGNEQGPRRPRGRPRKYANLSSASDGANANSSDPPAKRGRGRPPGSDKKKLNALEGEGSSLTAHIINVNAGEDIAAKIVAFTQQGPLEFCILSAFGAVSSAVLQSNNPSGVVTYEGPYCITDMSGSFMNTESNGTVTRTVNLTVSLAGPDGRVVGGIVAGMLVAGSQGQVVVGSFVRERVNVENNPESQSQSQGPPRSSESSEPTE